MDNNAELESKTINYIKNYYKKNSELPTMKQILMNIKGLNTYKFYKHFSGGISEACVKAGVPIPLERIEKTQKATKKRAQQEKIEKNTLIKEETMIELNKISYLENIPIDDVINNMINYDRSLRVKYALDQKMNKYIYNKFSDAERNGIPPKQIYQLMQYVFDSGILNVSEQYRNLLYQICNDMINRNRNYNELELYFYNKNQLKLIGYEECIKDVDEVIQGVLDKSLGVSKHLLDKEIFKFSVFSEIDIIKRMKYRKQYKT